MKQLTGLDASFLYMETGSTFGHVSSLCTFERPSGDYSPFDEYRAQIESMLDELEPFRRRLVEVPFQLDHPWWINDPDFDLDFHIRHIAIPAPGDDEQLAAQVARIISRPLDRSKPLWEAYVLEGLEGNRFAVLNKTHHATIDGASGVEMLAMMLDSTPHGDRRKTDTKPWKPEQEPDDAAMLMRTFANYARRPERLARANYRFARRMTENLREAGGFGDGLRQLQRAFTPASQSRGETGRALTAPPTPFNKAITPHRRWSFDGVPLSDIRALKSEMGATVNDVVMAMCAGGLRKYLERHDALPDAPLVSMIPVSIRTGNEDEVWTNRVSGMVAPIPTDCDDPVERVRRVSEEMTRAKEQFDLIPADELTDFTNFSPPVLATLASRASTQLRLADRVASPVNLVISNVPGPREPLYLAGAKMLRYYPVSTIAEGQGLNITVMSYLDSLDVGAVACRELIPDLEDLVADIIDELDVLYDAIGVVRPSLAAAADKTRATKAQASKKSSAKKTAPANKPAPAKTAPAKTQTSTTK